MWLYGGGYIVGSKQEYGNPAGLLARSQNNNNNGIIYVALNYRLGAFGWLAGPTLQEDGTANVGLHDQQLALEWVQTHIHKFGSVGIEELFVFLTKREELQLTHWYAVVIHLV